MPLPNWLTLAVPSRGRSKTFSPLVERLSNLKVFVDEREAESYARFGDRLVLHPGLKTISAIRQFMLDRIETDCVVMMDDDLIGVAPLVGVSRKPIRRADEVERVILSLALCARDSDAKAFGWNRNANPGFMRMHDPFHLVAPLAGAFGIIGRDIRFDTALIHGQDVDFTLKQILENRIVLADLRYYFDFGPVGGGTGGLQDVRTRERIMDNIATLERRWGKYLELSGKQAGFHGAGTKNFCMRIRVPR